jgi:hypothetical protein
MAEDGLGLVHDREKPRQGWSMIVRNHPDGWSMIVRISLALTTRGVDQARENEWLMIVRNDTG